MKSLTRTFLLTSAAWLSWQCTSNMIHPLELDYPGDKLTVVGYFSTDTVHLIVGQSTDLSSNFEFRDLVPDKPLVYLEDESGQFRYRLPQRDSLHFTAGRIGLEAGKKYRIVATAANLPSVESNFIELPDSLHILDLEYRKLPLSGELTNEVGFAIRDRSGPDFYFFDLAVKKGTAVNTVPFWTPEAQYLDACYDVRVFPDLCFQGKRTQLSYHYRVNAFFNGFRGLQIADSIVFRFGRISEEAYREKLALPVDDGLIEGINEPPLTYSNIKNGYGLVFAHSLRDYTIPVVQ